LLIEVSYPEHLTEARDLYFCGPSLCYVGGKAITTKLSQERLGNCVLAMHEWGKILESLVIVPMEPSKSMIW